MSGVVCFQAEDGIRDLVRSRGLGDVYKRQEQVAGSIPAVGSKNTFFIPAHLNLFSISLNTFSTCLLYTSDAADERSSVDLGGRRIIKKKNTTQDQYYAGLET